LKHRRGRAVAWKSSIPLQISSLRDIRLPRENLNLDRAEEKYSPDNPFLQNPHVNLHYKSTGRHTARLAKRELIMTAETQPFWFSHRIDQFVLRSARPANALQKQSQPLDADVFVHVLALVKPFLIGSYAKFVRALQKKCPNVFEASAED
jgi:hypothetical protein